MNTTLNPPKTEIRDMHNRLPNPHDGEGARAAALEKLLTLLAAEAQETHAHSTTEVESDSLNRLSRLRAAHAAYSLQTTGDMERVGNGAWMRRRYTTRRSVQN